MPKQNMTSNAFINILTKTDSQYLGQMKKVLTSHVGSLPRSQPVVDFIFAKEKQQPYDEVAFDHCMQNAVQETVKKQKDVGIDIVSDGETSKISYATYVKDRYTGFSGDSERNAPADLKLYPNFLQRIAQSGGTPTYARPRCTGEIKVKDMAALHKDIENLSLALNTNDVSRGFMNAASPGVVSLFLQNDFYASREAYLAALADVMKAEYEAIVAAGFDLQLDCPDLALSRHMLFTELSDSEFIRIANMHVEAMNHALQNIPEEKIRLHICWGNYEGPHVCDIGMEKMFDTLMSTKATYLSFESANPRHGHEWQVFAERKADIPENKILMPGVIDSTSNFIEHPKLVAERIEKFTNIVGPSRVVASTDCGFGTFAGFGAVDPDIAYGKLTSLAEGAQLINQKLGLT